MATIYFPYDQYLGNFIWMEDEKPTKEKVWQKILLLKKKGYWVSKYPEGDGLCFENKAKKNINILIDFIELFSDLEVKLPDLKGYKETFLGESITQTYYKTLKKHIEDENEITYVTLTGNCVKSGQEYRVKMKEEYYHLLIKGINILPFIGPENMEFLMSGISPKAWDEIHLNDEFPF